jgi:hypothetical protein
MFGVGRALLLLKMMPWSDWRQCVLMYPTRANRWSDIMDAIALCPEVKGKNKSRMDGYLLSWNRKDLLGPFARATPYL